MSGACHPRVNAEGESSPSSSWVEVNCPYCPIAQPIA